MPTPPVKPMLPSALSQCLCELAADVAGPVDKGLERNGAARAAYRGQHHRENLVAVAQRRDAVALAKRAGQKIRHRAHELIVAGRVKMFDLALDVFLAFAELTNDEVDSQGRKAGNDGGERNEQPARHAASITS